MPKKVKLKSGDYARLISDCECGTCVSLRARNALLTVISVFPDDTYELRAVDGPEEAAWRIDHLRKDVFLSAAAHAVKRKPTRAAEVRGEPDASLVLKANADSK